VRARRSAAAMRAAKRGVRGRASLEAADGDHFVPQPDSDGEGAGAAAQNRIGAVIERLKGWNQAALTDPDRGAESSSAGSSLGSSVLELCLGKEGAETCNVFGTFFDNGVN
jgi:hypothetical protein